MATDPREADWKERIERLEERVKTFRWLMASMGIFVAMLVWTSLGVHSIRARSFTVVDKNGRTLAELGGDTAGTHLSMYDANYRTRAQIVVSEGEGPRIMLFDKDQHQRMLLEVTDGAHFVAHSSDMQVRAVLTADDDAATFWLKDKKGFATILGNEVRETRKTDKRSGQPAMIDTVEKPEGVSIEIRDPSHKTQWKAP
jgi:hypothetical protein